MFSPGKPEKYCVYGEAIKRITNTSQTHTQMVEKELQDPTSASGSPEKANFCTDNCSIKSM